MSVLKLFALNLIFGPLILQMIYIVPKHVLSNMHQMVLTECSYSTLSPVSTGLCDHLWAAISPRHVTMPNKLTPSYITVRPLNRVPALIDWSKDGNVTSAGWQVTLFDPVWHASSHSGEG